MGNAAVAYPEADAGGEQASVLGLVQGAGVWIGASLPYGLSGWQAVRIQAFARTSQRDGIGIDMAHSGIASYSEQRFRLLYGRRIGHTLWIGGGADILRISALEYGQAATLTFGVSALANPLPTIWVGAHIYNPVQAEITGAPIPAILRLGAAWRPSDTFIALAEVEKDLERPPVTKIGAAYRPLSGLTVHMGIHGEPLRFTGGVAMHLNNVLAIAMAAEWHPVLGITPTMTLIWRKSNSR